MQTGTTGFLALLIWFLIVVVLVKAEESMEGNADAPERPIRHSQSLCAGEQDYVNKRKEKVLKSLSSLDINCTADAVPHIALLASGGGERAAVGSLGSLHQMEKDGLLDTFLYFGGVSGSTWTMSFLYSDPDWSTNMDKAIDRLSNSEVELGEALDWLEKKSEDEDFSLTDVWGVLTSAGIMKQLDLRRLSHEADRNATNPYPVYCAIERECFDNETFEGQWFEVSPHEAGFTEMGVFVETSLLGSKFNGGGLLERTDEMDMVELQGILGSAVAEAEPLKDILPSWLSDQQFLDAARRYLRVYNTIAKIMALIRGYYKEPSVSSVLDNLMTILEEKANRNESELWESKNVEEQEILSQQRETELLTAAEDWVQSLENGTFKTHMLRLIRKVFPLIIRWEWGTTANFLHQYQASGIPPCLHSKETFHLIDAGLLINVPYPPFLGDKREIDLIIAPEYSAGDMFETLTLARDYAKKSKRPFPEIDEKILEDKEWPKDCYVFEGKEKEPTIVYMPLFNRNNCKDAEEFKARMEEFSTFQRPYSQEKTDIVLETARANMENNKEILLQEIKKAALRKQRRKGAGDEPEAVSVKDF